MSLEDADPLTFQLVPSWGWVHGTDGSYLPADLLMGWAGVLRGEMRYSSAFSFDRSAFEDCRPETSSEIIGRFSLFEAIRLIRRQQNRNPLSQQKRY